MTSSVKRYPKSYFSVTSYKKHTQIINEPIIRDYTNIIKNYDAIIKFLHEKDYLQIYILIGDVLCLHSNHNARMLITQILTSFCIDKNDLNMLKILLTTKFFDKANEQVIMNKIIKEQRFDIFKFVIDNNGFDDIFNIAIIINNIKNPKYYFDVLVNKGYKFDDMDIRQMLCRNNTKAIQYLINIDYDIQQYYDDFSLPEFEFDMLILLHNNINITKYLNDIYANLCRDKHLNALIYLVDNFPELDLKYGLQRACENNAIQIIKYFLGKGLDIHDITLNSDISLDTIKFIIDVGYWMDETNLDKCLVGAFLRSDNIEDVYYFTNRGANVKAITEFNVSIVPSHLNLLEHAITMGKYNHIKFLIDNHYDLLQSHINKMFVIACANGKVDIAKYLLEFDIEMNVKSLVMACFFGHYEIVMMLLELGLDFCDVDENLFDVVITGYARRNAYSELYEKFVSEDDIFKNDTFKYGDGSNKIIELLMKYNVSVGNCEFVPKIHYNFITVDFFKYIVERIDDPNQKFNGTTLFGLSYGYNKAVSDMLINDYGVECIVVPPEIHRYST